MTEQAHATYAPSSAHRWIPCTASAGAIAALPTSLTASGEAAVEGTEAHDEIERILGDITETRIGDKIASRREMITPDHPAEYGIALFLSFVGLLPAGRIWVEQRVRLTDDIWGRCDVAHWHEPSRTLTIVDYKNGFVDVDPVENEQLRIYAAGSIYTHNLPAKWIRYVVVQPNSFMPVPRVKQWTEDSESLYKFATHIAAIPNGPKTFVFGEHCRDCPLFGMCPPTRDILAHLSVLMAGPASDVRPEQIAVFEACRKPIEHWFEALWKHGTKSALGGNIPLGMKLVTTSKHREWISEDAARDAVVERFGVSALAAPSPAQAEKLGLPGVDVLARKPDGGPALAFESDKRPPWTPPSAAKMFASVLEGAK